MNRLPKSTYETLNSDTGGGNLKYKINREIVIKLTDCTVFHIVIKLTDYTVFHIAKMQ